MYTIVKRRDRIHFPEVQKKFQVKDKNKEKQSMSEGNREGPNLINKRKRDANHLKKKEKRLRRTMLRKRKRAVMQNKKRKKKQSVRSCLMRAFKMSQLFRSMRVIPMDRSWKCRRPFNEVVAQ